jgi:hypothetical protein
MLSRNVIRVSAGAARARVHSRLLHSSRPAASKAVDPDGTAGHDPQISQGHAALGSGNDNKSPQDVYSQHAQAGKDASSSSNPLDAASDNRRETSHREKGNSGNPEAIGFQEQIGGASAEGSGGEVGGREEAQAPGVFSSIKQKLGMSTDAGDIKQNQHGGRGVTGTGTARKMHTSASVSAPAPTATHGQAPEASRQPKEETHGDQNAHLHHKGAAGEPDKGKGNAGENPTLPSHRVPQTSSNAPDKSSSSHQKRSLHTSARRSESVGNPSADPEQMVGGEDGQGEHSADSYFKDVDTTPSSGGKTHQIDSSSAALEDTSKTGPFSQSGPGEKDANKEYEHVSREAPYVHIYCSLSMRFCNFFIMHVTLIISLTLYFCIFRYDKPIPESGPERAEKQRYGNMEKWNTDKGPETSNPGDGPEGAAAGGRKPEGR